MSAVGDSTGGEASRFVADGRIVMRRIGDETLLVPVSSGVGDLDSIYVLTEVGSAVWALLVRPISLRNIVDEVCTEYDVAAEVAVTDVAEFIESLRAKKLVRVADEPSS